MPKLNNFDLIRLAAALQVAFSHAIADLGGAAHLRMHATATLFPGVPIFFFISGFLISKSFERNSIVTEYALNRFLRIYPGLVVCFVLSLLSVWLSGYLKTVSVSPSALLAWAAAQLSVVQFYNPDFMRHYGVGVLNGSMWTITVELQFYVLVPLLYGALRILHVSKRRSNGILLGMILAFMVVNQAFVYTATGHARDFWYKLTGVSFLPWFYMFLVGILFQRNFAVCQRWLGGRFVPLLGTYLVLGLMVVTLFHWGFGNNLNPLQFAALSSLTFAAAFSGNTLSERLLRRNDLSYGVYIYHAPVINLLLALGLATGAAGVVLVLAVTLVLAYASWRLVERPALGFKQHPLYQHRPASAES